MMMTRSAAFAIAMAGRLLLACLAYGAQKNAAQLVGPGAVTPYAGMGSQQRGYGYVRDPAAGFFVAGSSIDSLNGVYARVNVPPDSPHGACAHLPRLLVLCASASPSVAHILCGSDFQLAYLNEESGWTMGLVDAPPPDAGYRATGGEWSSAASRVMHNEQMGDARRAQMDDASPRRTPLKTTQRANRPHPPTHPPPQASRASGCSSTTRSPTASATRARP